MSDQEDESGTRRRLALLLLVLLVVILGAGIGTFTLGIGDEDDTADEQVDVTLEADGEGTLLAETDVYPGDAGTETITLRNTGQRAGRVSLASTVITDSVAGGDVPQSGLDDTTGNVSFARALEIRMTFVYPDGTERTVVGSASDYVPLTDVNASAPPDIALEPDEALIVELDWRVDAGAGNEIQNATAAFDAVFQLQAPETE